MTTPPAGWDHGPLQGVRVVELAGLGPTPFAAMLLADLGADVVRVDRADAPRAGGDEVYHRGRPSVGLDLKSPTGLTVARQLAERADVLVEGFRPGVAERLGLGPERLWEDNPRLVYARMTGWGQDGPLAAEVGHDINYLALVGALDQFRRVGQRPVPPMNLLGDFGAGATYLLIGVLSALRVAERTGRGQVVDAAIVDGVASLMGSMVGRRSVGRWDGPPGTNLLDTGAPFYEVYRTSDDAFVAVGAIEPRFYAALLRGLGLDPATLAPQLDRAAWPATKEHFAQCFASRTRAEWEQVFAETEACVTPVLSVDEARRHPHVVARGLYVEQGGVLQPEVAPRLSLTPGSRRRGGSNAGADNEEALRAWGIDEQTIHELGSRAPSTKEETA